jgi:electron transport complex protein RnfB
MTDENYERLADALDRLPNGFPRTPGGVEIRILKKIFSPEQAALAGWMSRDGESVEEIAARAGLPASDARSLLKEMAKRGMVWFDQHDGKAHFRLAPFIVGIYEAQVDVIDHELAHLVEHYMLEGGAAGMMKPQPALHRVVPSQGTVKSEWILPYEDVRSLIMEAKSFYNGDCVCRTERELVGHKCTFPVNMCLSFSPHEGAFGPETLSREEALKILDKTEELGLVHTVSNTMKGMGYVCNCCGCCCGILRGITEWGIQESVAYASYYAVIDEDLCLNCGICQERCQVNAILEQDMVTVVERARCIGCGLCVSGCPNDAVRLELKPEAERVLPPADFGEWEHQRLHNRHLDE